MNFDYYKNVFDELFIDDRFSIEKFTSYENISIDEGEEIIKQIITYLYHKKNMTQKDIADIMNCAECTIRRYMKKWNIDTNNTKKPTKEKLYHLYWIKKMSQSKIAGLYDTHRKVVSRWLYGYGIKTRCTIPKENRSGEKKTNEQFISEVRDLVHDEYTFLEEYKNAKISILCRHNKCKNEWYIAPNSFLQGRRCPECGRRSMIEKQSKTNKKFISEVLAAVGGEYIFLEKYKGFHEKIVCKHNICSHTWEITPADFLSGGKRCPKCQGVYQRNHDEFVEDVKKSMGEEYRVLSEFTITDDYILVKHLPCNTTYSARADHLLDGSSGCSTCMGDIVREKLAIGIDELKKRVDELTSGEYSVLSDTYKNNKTPVKFKHNLKTCEYVFEMAPSHFINQGCRCIECAKEIRASKRRHSYSFVQQSFKDRGLQLLAKHYKNENQLLKYKCSCGNIAEMCFDALLHGGQSNCAKCSSSRGESRLIQVLEDRKVEYKHQLYIDDCKNVNPLPFDIAIFKEDELICLIEYDGIQHFESQEHWGGKNQLQYVKKNDKIKDKYCKNNNIPLLRVPYWDFSNIDDIIQNEIIDKYQLS
ncbi:MAG: hypothetical protein ACOCRO_06465 [Halanaerobiales bacterium]